MIAELKRIWCLLNGNHHMVMKFGQDYRNTYLQCESCKYRTEGFRELTSA